MEGSSDLRPIIKLLTGNQSKIHIFSVPGGEEILSEEKQEEIRGRGMDEKGSKGFALGAKELDQNIGFIQPQNRSSSCHTTKGT